MKDRKKQLKGDALFSASRGAIEASTPASYAAADPSPPEATLRLRHVAGYRIRDSRSNLFFVHATPTQGAASDTIVFPAAALGVVQDLTKTAVPRQAYFSAHTDDVVALTYHAGTNVAASGDLGLVPVVHVWRPSTASVASGAPIEPLATLKLPKGAKGVAALAFSHDAKYVAAAAQDNDHTLLVWDWAKSPEPVAVARGGSSPIVDMAFGPADEFMSVGQKAVRLWSLDLPKKTLNARNGVFGDKAEIQVVTSVAHLAKEDAFVTGTQTGDVLVWGKDGRVAANHAKVHTGQVFALTPLPAGGFASGGKDGHVQLWSAGKLEPNGKPIEIATPSTANATAAIRALDAAGHKLLVGLDDATVATYCLNHKHTLVHLEGHSCAKDAELWGLAVVDAKHVVTAGDDATLLLWDTHSGAVAHRAPLPAPARAVAASAARDVVAVGLQNGEVHFFAASSLKHLGNVAVSKKAIAVLAFSPGAGSRLAAGAHDTTVYILGAGEGKDTHYTVLGSNPAHSSFLTAIDWSADGTTVQSNSGDYELLFTHVGAHGTPGSEIKQITQASSLRETKWATYTCTIGWPTRGIWSEGQDGLDINAVDRFLPAGVNDTQTAPRALLALGNDASKVELLRYPAVHGGRATPRKTYGGHSSHVTNVRFAADGNTLFSTGGMDGCLMFWSVV
ncbi:Echinoderm microtubule-associated protein-like 5 [Blastocladiella emersonii ATCC 22665]|nr:Echinoderm microtubule-associated protein-like 5 [Blastocladiella emersonii ATCC 22665]